MSRHSDVVLGAHSRDRDSQGSAAGGDVEGPVTGPVEHVDGVAVGPGHGLPSDVELVEVRSIAGDLETAGGVQGGCRCVRRSWRHDRGSQKCPCHGASRSAVEPGPVDGKSGHNRPFKECVLVRLGA